MIYIPTHRWLALVALGSIGMLAFGILYLQNHLGLEPCPMCIVQRYALIGVIVWCVLGASANAPRRTVLMSWLVVITAGFGAFVAARQTWLQWYPPEVVSCGRDFYGMIENFPLQRAVPMIFKGSGDCTKIDWSFLGGSIANWSFLVFSGILVLMLLLRWRDGLFRATPPSETLS
ncbi:MAG: disulfide bond formation protein B [Burkholderiales bacterium]|nr:disulfide bond formation protein B [Burkholderiales bacterium]